MVEGSATPTNPAGESTEDRTLLIAARLKQLYARAILPIEKKYRYDYFFDSPLLSDVEFDGESSARWSHSLRCADYHRKFSDLTSFILMSIFRVINRPLKPSPRCFSLDSIPWERRPSFAIC